MTLSTTNNESTGTGNGILTTFAFNFPVQSSSQVLVYTQTGDADPVLVDSGRTITPYTSTVGGEVEFDTAPASGVTIIMRRVPNYQQNTTFPLGRSLDERALELALDKLTMQDQDLLQRSNRSLQFPVGEDSATANVLPVAAERANKAAIFDDDGNISVSTDDYEDQAAASAASAAAASASATAAATSAAAAATQAAATITIPSNSLILATDTSTSRSLANRFSEFANVLDFGALPYADGSASAGDSTAAFADAIATGKPLLVPAVEGAITVYDVGEVLLADGTVIWSPVAPSYNTTISSNVVIRPTSGASFLFDISGVRGALFDGICLDGVDKTVHGIYAATADANHIALRNTSIRFCNFGFGGANGRYIRSSQIDGCRIVNGTRGLRNLIDCEMNGGVIAAHTSHGVDLTAGCNLNRFNNMRNEFNQGSGFNLEGASEINITGCQVDRNYQAGCYMNATVGSVARINIIGGVWKRNGRDGTFGEDCHFAFDGNVSNVNIVGAITGYGGDDGTGTSPSPAKIITIVSGNPDKINIIGSDLLGYGSSVMSGSTSGEFMMKHNIGAEDRSGTYASSNTIASGASQTLTMKFPAMASTSRRSLLVNVTGVRNATTTMYAANYQIDMVRDSGGTPVLTATEVTDPTNTFATTPNRLAYDAQTANFTAGQVVTGSTSGATATISSDADSGTTGILTITGASGVFQDNEIITDPLGGSATVNGLAYNASGHLVQFASNSTGSQVSVYIVNATGNNAVYDVSARD